jgi:hypothetical protein
MAISQVVVQSPVNETIFTDSAMGATADAVKASSATVYSIFIDNTANGTAVYVKLWNQAAGGVTVGTTAPDEVVYVPGASKITHILFTGGTPGKIFGTALAAACVTTGGTGGAGAPASSVPVSIVYA